MQSPLKWFFIVIAVLLGLGLLGIISVYVVTEQRLDQVYDVEVEAISVPEGEVVLTGYPLMIVSFCQECHGPAFSGQAFPPDQYGLLVTANLTGGKGGIGKAFTDEDWVRAIRHGIGKDGRGLVAMPSIDFYNLSDRDLGLIIAYLKTLPPVDNELPEIQFYPMGRIYLLQDPSILSAAVIDHSAPRPVAPEPGITVAYGAYLANICTLCHGKDLGGGGSESSGVNLTPGGDLAHWTEEDFVKALRTGITPEGEELDREEMMWELTNLLTGDELKAIWLYLQSLPAVESPAVPEPGG